MKTLPLDTRVRIAAALADGVAMRGAERLTGATRKTIGLLLLHLGRGCDLVHAARMHELTCDVLELDEVWAFVGVKQGHKDEFHPEEYGDSYTFVAEDVTSRAVVSYVTDKRTGAATAVFAKDIRARVLGKPQLTTDGWISYESEIEAAFGTRVHYAKNFKTYANDTAGGASRDDVRYSRGKCIASQKVPIIGTPDERKITTAHIERNNLTTRMWCRRLTRLTTCFSRRLVFLRAATSLHFAVYNFTRVHSALRITPAMQLGVTDHVWSMEELVTAALAALDGSTPAVPPIVPPTPAKEAGIVVRAARLARERKAAKVVVTATTPVVSTPITAATFATTAFVSARRVAPAGEATVVEAPRELADASEAVAIVAPETAPMRDPQMSFDFISPADGAEIAPRELPTPTDASMDFRWLW